MTFTPPPSLSISGKECLPIIEGGKGIAMSTGRSAGAMAAAGAVGTFSAVNADTYDENGNIAPQIYRGTTRRERHDELVQLGIEGGIAQAKIAHEMSNGNGRIHMNILWEMGGAEQILTGILDGTKGLVHGITCGAGMPYKLGEIAANYQTHYYPIVSSMRAFRALWKRGYHKTADWLGGVVYEDPWKAGGHNGLSNSEDPKVFEEPLPRVRELRKFMNEVGLQNVPIVMAGGVWFLEDWQEWINNPEIGPITFQYGTRPIVTQESEAPAAWKKKMLTLKEGDVYLNRFSPTGFYSSAVENDFIRELIGRNDRQVKYAHKEPEGNLTEPFKMPPRGRPVYVEPKDITRIREWQNLGFTEAMKTPDGTLIFTTPEKAAAIHDDQVGCMGCLSHCRFSNWKDHGDHQTGKKPDPRSFCIQKTLYSIAHEDDSRGDPIDWQLMFSGHNAYKFANDPFYANGNIPTVKELVDRIMIGK